MLRVPSVEKTVEYWAEKGGTVLSSSKDKDGKLKGAFVALGNHQSTVDNCFALELVHSNHKLKLGNSISYIGISMLLQFQNNLVGAAAGEKPCSQGKEPNGIEVKSVASAPGDLLARFCLKTTDMEATKDFYSTLLGMQVAAEDDKNLCLRYDKSDKSLGIPTTLVFELTDKEVEFGNCLDHFVIATSSNIDAQFELIKAKGAKVFMKPTEMFGKKVLGVRDPMGYKVILSGEVFQ